MGFMKFGDAQKIEVVPSIKIAKLFQKFGVSTDEDEETPETETQEEPEEKE